jgi:hypothetical protein
MTHVGYTESANGPFFVQVTQHATAGQSVGLLIKTLIVTVDLLLKSRRGRHNVRIVRENTILNGFTEKRINDHTTVTMTKQQQKLHEKL